jgi:hypothetical protein
LTPEQGITAGTVKPKNVATSCRGLFGLLAGAVAVETFGLLSGSKAQAQGVTTQMVGEEGGGQRVTTYALGEEGGRPVRVRG